MDRLKYIFLGVIIFFLISAAACHKIAIKYPEEPVNKYDWPQFGHNPQHTNHIPVNMTPPFKLIWDHKTSSAIGASLVAAQNVVLFGTYKGNVEGIDLDTGKSSGFIAVRGTEERTIAIYKDNLFIVRRIGQPSFEFYNLTRGKSIWEKKGEIILQEPLLVNDHAFILDTGGKMISMSLEDGSEVWSIELDAQSHTTPAYCNGLFVVGDDMGNVYAIDNFPHIVWKYSSQGTFRAAAAISEKTVYIGSTNSNFYAIRLEDGTKKWSFRANGKIYHPAAVDAHSVIFGATDHRVYCLDKQTGTEKWTFKANSVISTAPLITGKTVFVGSLDNFMYALDLNSGEKLWSFEASGRIRTHPIIVRDKLVFASEGNMVYCFAQE
ncbi:PQQ-binding-like beta-propeller repeat protein [candidate division KSB1 bacterium]|nr:PQQ-binding-like beta-propeller repeat protein [candidate division KSB1 bacterium]